ncbi:MAG: acyl--CoA ligase, partial [Deltaproteobacteria bacterium]|nr:acyl--CoA ligase [Deltaproteobacteria bacterium]
TSGSTAFPKGALRNHRSLIGIAHYLIDEALHISEVDRLLSYFPFYHIAGCVYLVLGAHLKGSTLYLMEAFEPEEALRLVDQEKITFLGGFETHFNLLINHPHFRKYDVTSARKVLLATGPEWYDRVREAGMGSEVLAHHYGFTEGTGVVVPHEEKDYAKRKYTNGKPFPGIEVKIVDPETGSKKAPGEAGEICLRGWTLFQGYYKMPEETRRSMDEEGFFHTGDYGWFDEEGFLYYRGRYKMMIKTGGENVSEKEVEVVLEEHRDIKAVQVVGVPDPLWGEAVTAVIEVKPGKILHKEDLVNFCRGKLAGFKIPKNVVFIQAHEWPVTPTGKIIKADLKKLAAERLGIKEIAAPKT